ncbi:MAG: serine/threonine-protein kinase, partial [Myxococcota bacterium]
MSGSAQRSDGSRDEPVSGEIPRLPERLIGEVLGERYRVDALLGEGGIGRVYRATHLKLDRPVAVKVLLEEHRELALQRQRFEREVRTLARLRHPNIVTVVDFGVAEGLPYLVMELVEGEDLDALLEGGGPFAPERAFEVLRQVLKSLAYAHEKGIVHRDLKPSNVLLTSLPDGSEHVEVLDFGLAKFIDPVEEAASPKLTRAGCIVGSPAYMAPE